MKPAEDEGVGVEKDAADFIINYTKRYPYFLQEWGKHAWDIAEQSPITQADVEAASDEAIATLDESFFRVRFDRLTPSEEKYLRARLNWGPAHIAPGISQPTSIAKVHHSGQSE